MKNFLKERYSHYYIQAGDGREFEVTRAECFAKAEEPTAENPFKQRWFYDIEAGYIVRLPRNAKSEKLHRTNCAALKREERERDEWGDCVWKDSGKCGNDCENCDKKVYRTVELDKPLSASDDGSEMFVDIEAPDTFAESDGNARLTEIFVSLNEKRQKVCRLYFLDGHTAKEIGETLGVTESAVLHQIATIKKQLQNFFENPHVLEKICPYRSVGGRKSPQRKTENE